MWSAVARSKRDKRRAKGVGMSEIPAREGEEFKGWNLSWGGESGNARRNSGEIVGGETGGGVK